MSFKREGDDHSWLNVLNKRRVSELFAEGIPEDEAFLTKNGRLACLVCQHRPVFDTVNMLAVHRSGKKHLAYAEEFLSKKLELDELRLKRRHEQYICSGTLPPDVQASSSGNISKSTTHPLLGACIYDPRCKRRKTDRRPTLDLTKVTDPLPSSVLKSSLQFSSIASISSEKPPQTIADIRQYQKLQLARDNPPQIKPYVGKRTGCSATASISQDYQHYGCSSTSVSSSEHSRIIPIPVRTDIDGTARVVISGSDADSVQPCCSSGLGSVANKRGKRSSEGNTNGSMHSDSQSERITGFLKAIGSGWKRSRDGSWVKDETAEFDSDEEPPDIV